MPVQEIFPQGTLRLHNLAAAPLPTAFARLLGLDTSFVYRCALSLHQQVAELHGQLRGLINNMRWKLVFAHDSSPCPALYKKKGAPGPAHPLLEDAEREMEQLVLRRIRHVVHSQLESPVLRNDVRAAREFMKDNPQLKLLDADKNLGPCVVKLSDYVERLRSHLGQPMYKLWMAFDAYAPEYQTIDLYRLWSATLWKDANAQFTNPLPVDRQVFTTAQSNALDGISVAELAAHLYRSAHPEAKGYAKYMMDYDKDPQGLPLFRLNPKIQKVPWEGRPIVGAHSWSTTAVAQVWAKLSDELLDFARDPANGVLPPNLHFPKDSAEVLRRMHAARPVFSIKADAVAMYTNLQYNHLRRALRLYFREEGATPPTWDASTVNFFRAALYLLQRENYFYVPELRAIYRQTDGIAMGSNAAVGIAMLGLMLADIKVAHHNPDLFFERYVDDLLVYGEKDDNMVRVQQDFNVAYAEAGLKLTWFPRKTEDSYLDLHFRLHGPQQAPDGWPEFKKLATYPYPHWRSCIPKCVKEGIVIGESIRMLRLCTHERSFDYCKYLLAHRLYARGYPAETVQRLADQVPWQDFNDLSGRRVSKNAHLEQPPLYVALTYDDAKRGILSVKKEFEELIRPLLPEAIDGYQFFQAWKPSKSLGAILRPYVAASDHRDQPEAAPATVTAPSRREDAPSTAPSSKPRWLQEVDAARQRWAYNFTLACAHEDARQAESRPAPREEPNPPTREPLAPPRGESAKQQGHKGPQGF